MKNLAFIFGCHKNGFISFLVAPRCGRRLREENPYWIPKTETSKVCRKDEDGKRRQERKQTGVLRVDNEAKHGGRLPELASFYENMRKLEV